MRNKFVYSCGVKIHASGFDELLESIFCLLLVVEVFSLQKNCRDAWRMVVGWHEVGWIWRKGQNFVAQFIQLLKHWLCDMQLGFVVEKIGPFLLTTVGCRYSSFQNISPICWVYFSDVMVSPEFRKLWWITLAADCQTATMTFFWCKFGFGKCFEAAPRSTNRARSTNWAGLHQLYKIHFLSHVTIRLWNCLLLLCTVRENKHFKSTIFLIRVQLMRHPLT